MRRTSGSDGNANEGPSGGYTRRSCYGGSYQASGGGYHCARRRHADNCGTQADYRRYDGGRTFGGQPNSRCKAHDSRFARGDDWRRGNR